MDLKTNEPFWLVKNGIISSYPSLRNDTDCEVLIVGGGITGSLIAHQSIKDGYNTILIDKREIANGSSSATTSMLQYEIDIPLYNLIKRIGEKNAVLSYQACGRAIKILEEICKEIDSKAGFKCKKSLYFAAFKKDVKELKLELEARKKAGFRVVWLENHNIEEKYHIYNTYGGILSDLGASVDVFKLVHEILNYNRTLGLQVFDKTEATSVKERQGYSIVELSTGAMIKAKKIIYCVGYESTKMIKQKIVNLISTFAIVSEVDEVTSTIYENLLVWNTAKPYMYFRTTDDGRLLIGGGDEEFTNPIKRDALTTKKNGQLLKLFEKYFANRSFYSDFQWAGTFGETKDGLPYIGVHPEFKNSYFVLGFGGNGITFSVIGMEMFSLWMKNSKHSLSQCFSFDR